MHDAHAKTSLGQGLDPQAVLGGVTPSWPRLGVVQDIVDVGQEIG